MSFVDLFAWIVLTVLAATAVAVFGALGIMRATLRASAASMGGGRDGRELGHADLQLLTAGPDLGLCRCVCRAGDACMIVVLLNSYIALLALFVWVRFIRSTCSGSCR